MIYFIQSLDQIKIGYTRFKNIEERINSLRVGNPHGLVVIGTIKGTIQSERELHEILDKYRTSGEWFTNCEPVREFINDILTKERIITRRYAEFGANGLIHREVDEPTSPKKINDWIDCNKQIAEVTSIATKVFEIDKEISNLLIKRNTLNNKYIKLVRRISK